MEIVRKILWILLNQGAAFFVLAGIVVFLHCFYDAGFQWTARKTMYMLVYLAVDSVLIYFLDVDNSFSLILSLCIFVIVILDYKGNKILGILKLLLAYFTVSFSSVCLCMNAALLIIPGFELFVFDFADPEIMITVSDIPKEVMLFINLVHVLFFGMIFLYLYFCVYKRGVVLNCGTREVIMAAIYPFTCILVSIVIVVCGKDNAITMIILTTMSIVMAVMLPTFVYYTRISQHFQKLTEYQQHHMQAELAHFEQYKRAQEETVLFRHDIRNNLLCLNEILQTGTREEAQTYLQSLVETTDSLRKKYVSGDEMLDCIIAVKAGTMAQQGIAFELDGVLAGGLLWRPVDICNVFANALDNAMEACQRVAPERRRISMNIRSTPGFWFVTIENPVAEAVDTARLFRKNGGYSSKSNAGNHGFGTYNMKHTVESYGNMLRAECTPEVFRLEIMIDKKSAG